MSSWDKKIEEQEKRFAEIQAAAAAESKRLEALTITFSNGSKYVGDTLNDDKITPHGYGEFYWPKLVLGYDGEWYKGKMHGKGRYIWKNGGHSWNGTFRNDELHGRGTWRSENGREKRDCYYVLSQRIAWVDELIEGLRISLKERYNGDDWKSGTITSIKKDPPRYYIKWDLNSGSWVDLAIETWKILDCEPHTELVLKR